MKRISGFQAAGAFFALPLGIALLMGAATAPAPAAKKAPAKKTAPTKKAPTKKAPAKKATPATTAAPEKKETPVGNVSGTAGNPQPTGKQTAGEVYKNILVLKDLPADKMLEVMQQYSVALGVQCTYCHVEDFAVDIAHKKITRNMILLTQQINKNPSAQNRVTCFTCHQGSEHTVNSPEEAAKRDAARLEAEKKANAAEEE